MPLFDPLRQFLIFCRHCRVTSSFATNYGVVAGAARPQAHAVIHSYISLLLRQTNSRVVGIFSLKAIRECWIGSSNYPCSGSSVSLFINQNSEFRHPLKKMAQKSEGIHVFIWFLMQSCSSWKQLARQQNGVWYKKYYNKSLRFYLCSLILLFYPLPSLFWAHNLQ